MPAASRSPETDVPTRSGSPTSPSGGETPPAAPPPVPGGSGPVTAKQAGRGGAAVAVAKVYFILMGLVQQVALKRVLGLESYGALSSALQAASITYNPVVQTSIQGVSRVVASAETNERPRALRRALSTHALLALVSGAAFFVAARPLGNWMGAPHIVLALQLLSAVMVVYGLYAPLVGALNGLHRFLAQAGLDVLAATLRTVGLIGGAIWLAQRASSLSAAGSPTRLGGVEGSILGFVVGASIVLVVSLALVGIGKGGGTSPTLRRHLAFVLPLLLGQVLTIACFRPTPSCCGGSLRRPPRGPGWRSRRRTRWWAPTEPPSSSAFCPISS